MLHHEGGGGLGTTYTCVALNETSVFIVKIHVIERYMLSQMRDTENCDFATKIVRTKYRVDICLHRRVIPHLAVFTRLPDTGIHDKSCSSRFSGHDLLTSVHGCKQFVQVYQLHYNEKLGTISRNSSTIGKVYPTK